MSSIFGVPNSGRKWGLHCHDRERLARQYYARSGCCPKQNLRPSLVSPTLWDQSEHHRSNMTSSTVDYPRKPVFVRSQLPPGPPEWPVLDQTWRYIRDPIGLMQEAAAYGDLVTLSVKPFLMYLVNHPDLIREVFITQHRRVGRGRLGEAMKVYLWGKPDHLGRRFPSAATPSDATPLSQTPHCHLR